MGATSRWPLRRRLEQRSTPRTQPRWTTADLGRIRARVLVCAGEHDLIRRDHTESIARAIPGAKLWIVPGASHGAMLEKPELVNPRVLRFLAEK